MTMKPTAMIGSILGRCGVRLSESEVQGMCVMQDIYEMHFYERRWTANQPPDPAEWRATCALVFFSPFSCL